MKREEFLSNLHFFMDRYESVKGNDIWNLEGTNLLDDFYSFCEEYGKKQNVNSTIDEVQGGKE